MDETTDVETPAERMLELPGLRMRVLESGAGDPGAVHFLPDEQPDDIARRIRAFVRPTPAAP